MKNVIQQYSKYQGELNQNDFVFKSIDSSFHMVFFTSFKICTTRHIYVLPNISIVRQGMKHTLEGKFITQ
jgi:hypothetical protein